MEMGDSLHNGKPYSQFSYDKHARTCDPADFLGQVLRTVNGIQLQDNQLEMIIEAIRSKLSLNSNDVLLELACGNGMLSRLLFDSCYQYLGTDISEYLISIAIKNFQVSPNYQFLEIGAADYVRKEPSPKRFTKALCYAGFQYFNSRDVRGILRLLFEKFTNIEKIYIGNIPDKERSKKFYLEKQPSEEELLDCCTAIGRWYTRSEFEKLANRVGWKVEFSIMPDEFYASYYRFDALLSRQND